MVETLLSSERKINSENNAQSETTARSDQTMELHFVHNKLEAFQSNILHDVQKRMSAMIDEFMQELRQHELPAHEFGTFAIKPLVADTSNNITIARAAANEKQIWNTSTEDAHYKKDTIEKFRDKVFRIQESYLPGLFDVGHRKTIYHLFYVICLLFLLHGITFDYFVDGSVSFGLGTFKIGFANIHYVLGVWLIQKTFVCSVYYALKGWSNIRSKLEKQQILQHVWSLSCLLAYITSQVIFAYMPTKICLKLDLPFVSACALLMESTRMLMKMHGFVRTICARVLQGKLKTEDDDDCAGAFFEGIPPFQKYFYYLFAPTLLYRDNYPRTAVIRWKFAAARFLEVVAVAFLDSYIYERHIEAHFGNFGKEELSAGSIIMKLFDMLVPCVTIFLCTFHLLLHSWLNFTGELLRFGDRMFYRDWWTASNFDGYYRNWNIVVHDWLYDHIYKDFYNHIFRGSKFACSLAVFIISALFHEYIVGYALQVFFPVLFFLFGVVSVLMIYITRFVPKAVGNTMIWFALILGNCMMISLYSMDYFTSKNCPKETYESWSDCLVPHLWTCYKK